MLYSFLVFHLLAGHQVEPRASQFSSGQGSARSKRRLDSQLGL